MSEEILINVTPQETRVAIMEQGVVQELHIERTSSLGLVGNVYKGKVCRVLPGMQSAFIEIGLSRAAFLHIADILEYEVNAEKPIQELLHEGQTVMVQVIKEPIGSKGARLTTQISIAGRFLVYLPQQEHIGVSQRIGDEAEREQLLVAFNATDAGYPLEQTIHGLFEEQVQRTPEALAVLHGGQRLSYAELNERANQLAHYLR